jgi:phage repressor protein C with HTH and peptisase S24 domain
MIKQFLRRSDDQVVLHQFNPAKDLKLAAKDIKNIYRIVAAGEGS